LVPVLVVGHLQNALLHVFAHDALVLFALVSACGGWSVSKAAAHMVSPAREDRGGARAGGGGGGEGGGGGKKKVIEAEGVELVLEGEESAGGVEGGSGPRRVGVLEANRSKVAEAYVRLRALLMHELVFPTSHDAQVDLDDTLR
jgi:hypothetical protein